jgi:hypothetical protein
MKNIYKIILLSTVFIFSGCETLDLDQTESPSDPNKRFLDPIYAFNYVQLELPKFVDATNSFTQRVTRQMAMTGGDTYNNAFKSANFNRSWRIGYDILKTIKVIEPIAIREQQPFIIGAAKIIKCYTLATLVDVYGDVPYSEALQGNANLNPKYDKGQDVYKAILIELDNAIAIFNAPPPFNQDYLNKVNDLYYDKDKAKWITLAKTLKFKMYLTARQAGTDLGVNIKNEIENILTTGDIIDTPSEDFFFQYGPNRDVPNSRHPMYNDQYELGGGAYIGNYMFWSMTVEKGFNVAPYNDPRINFYFYKQADVTTSIPDFTLPRLTRPAHYNNSKYASFYDATVLAPYKVSNWTTGSTIAAGGFWGRDHGDGSGIPPDNELRTVAGVYPIGGKYASSVGSVQHSGTDGAFGAGIMPILLTSYVHFMKAEAILELAIVGDPKTEFLAGINASLDRATKQINNYPPTLPTSLATDKTAYSTFMELKYNAQTTQARKLEIIIKEYYIAAWGNGIEPYNNYRRTGYPSNFQPTLETFAGNYFNCALYSADAAENNQNAPLNSRTRRVFWDKANLTLE